MQTLNISLTPAHAIELPVTDFTGHDMKLAHGLLNLEDNPVILRTGAQGPTRNELIGRASMLCDIVQRQSADCVYVDVQDEAFQDILMQAMEGAGLIVVDASFGQVVTQDAA